MPDEEMLALWVEDELTGESAAAVNAWAAAQPEWLARREEAREIKALLGNLPAAEDPPYADFFNSRISREIARESVAAVAAAPAKKSPGSFWRFFLPATAVAGMAFCFWAGTRVVPAASQGSGIPPLANVPAAMPVLYTPEQGVSAAYFNSSPAHAEVIVLNGVAAIPDSFEVPETAAVEEPAPATADIEHQQ